ncbi:MAG: hypothetical protein HRT44_04635 [Bdellovibrionales bacterium]|nr:hypothetical protein [Bdellovibrionales bacterium]NQZ18529.1 hypothetical protein [Bdellovibrionales bacterium]
MLKVLIISLLSMFLSTNSYAGTASYYDAGKGYDAQAGCNGIGDIVNNINDYEVINTSVEVDRISICEVHSYYGNSRIDVLKQISKRAEDANCFSVNIDEDNKTISVTLKDNIYSVTRRSEELETYSLEGFTSIAKPSERTRITHYCVIQRDQVEGILAEFLEQ